MEINCTNNIRLVAFLDEQHIVGCDDKGKIRRWRVDNGLEMGVPMDGGADLCCISVSKDGKWIANGTSWGRGKVWDASNHEKVAHFHGWHSMLKRVCAIDISPQKRIATGSTDKTVFVWGLETGERLLGPLQHDNELAAVKFSPDGRWIATATWQRASVRIYDSDGSLLSDLPIPVASSFNQSLAWTTDSRSLFALSSDGNIHCIDASTGTSLTKWLVQRGNDKPKWIGLASSGKLVAAATDFSVSFWDPATHQQIGSAIDHVDSVTSFAILEDRKIALAASKKIIFHDIPTPRNHDDTIENNGPETTTPSLTPRAASSSEEMTRLERTIQEFRNQLVQEKESIIKVMESFKFRIDLHAHARSEESNNKSFVHLGDQAGHWQRHEAPTDVRRTADLKKEIPNTTIEPPRTVLPSLDTSAERAIANEQVHECEDLYERGNIHDSAIYLTEFVNNMSDDLKSDKAFVNRVAEFGNKCATDLEKTGDIASSVDEAVENYTTALLLPSLPTPTLPNKWAKAVLTRGSWHDAWNTAAEFKSRRFHGNRAICEVLEEDGHRVVEAVECFRRMQTELPEDPNTKEEHVRWEHEFRERCSKKLEGQGDSMMEVDDYNGAIGYYSNALSLSPPNIDGMIVKCSNARKRLLENALNDAERDIKHAPSSYKSYKQKHFVLHSMGRHKEAFMAFETMLTMLEQSPFPNIRELRDQYVNATPKIREIVQKTVRDIPNTLINTATGRLCDKTQQEKAFEELPIFNELRSSMTRKIDDERIRREVKEFYRYVMFSHRWQPDEPTFQMVENTTVYRLPASLAHTKLVKFCGLVRRLCFIWAWSDTCCVNQADKGILQEAVVAMFRWYHGSSLTIVYLLDVSSKLQKYGDLWRCIWNTRGWTYQEYVAPEVVQFYTEDWQLYLGLTMFNHKKSPLVIREMEQAMKMKTQELSALQPGPDRVREKLYLASSRETTREEDIAYCLFGIFGTAQPIIYGEGKQVAVGRLLEHILARSGNVTTLSWTGTHGSNHSYLPAALTVYDQIVPPHLPQPIDSARMDKMVTSLHPSDLSLAVPLYNRLHDLAPLSVVAGRLRLPGIVFQLANVRSEPDSDSSKVVYHARSPMLGDVEIKTVDRSIDIKGLLLIHPWISPLLEQEFSHDSQSDVEHARRLVVRLKQKFGALLLARVTHAQYRRVATDCLIMVQVREETGVGELMAGIQTVNVQ